MIIIFMTVLATLPSLSESQHCHKSPFKINKNNGVDMAVRIVETRVLIKRPKIRSYNILIVSTTILNDEKITRRSEL